MGAVADQEIREYVVMSPSCLPPGKGECADVEKVWRNCHLTYLGPRVQGPGRPFRGKAHWAEPSMAKIAETQNIARGGMKHRRVRPPRTGLSN